ncbi:MAG: hypothetical protein JST89_26470, partial [Cyanobacteria bacterium SZAS-4]|nr:hypothetical protein [Cyanobacteria bacterium SZAS-4]
METVRKQFLFVSLFSLITSFSSFPLLQASANAHEVRQVIAYQYPSRTLERAKTEAKPDPDQLYHRVWKLIKEDYYEDTYNGQDWEIWRHRYDGKLKTTDDAHKAIETMLASLGDRYTRFLDNDAFDDENTQIHAKLCGIGIQIGVDKQKNIIVIAPIDDTPASKA